MLVRPAAEADRDWIRQVITERWGLPIVAHGVAYAADTFPALVAVQGRKRLGLLTYRVDGSDCEIVTLDSLQQFTGIGTALIDGVRTTARTAGCKRLWLITSNDNLVALRFYQRRGFLLVKVDRGAVDRARQIKPAIPQTGHYDIPIRDEIELELTL